MRKLLALILIFALCACAPAWAEGVTDARGLTGSGESSVRGDLSARTDTDLYVVTNDGSDKVLMRIPRAGGASVRVESAGSISDLVPAGDLLYFLRVNNGTATLMRRNTDSTRSEVYTFPLGSSVSALSYYGGNLYALIDNQLNVIYPATGQCTLLSGTAMLDYVIVGDTVYYISGSDMMPYQTASLLGNGSLTVEGGCLYRMSLTSGESSLVVKTGIEDLRYNNGALYFHNLSDNYVMGDATREWMEGKLYRYAFRLLALCGTRRVRIFGIIRAASAMCASVLFATNAASVAREIKHRSPVAVFLQRLGYLGMNKRYDLRKGSFAFPPAVFYGVFVNFRRKFVNRHCSLPSLSVHSAARRCDFLFRCPSRNRTFRRSQGYNRNDRKRCISSFLYLRSSLE